MSERVTGNNKLKENEDGYKVTQKYPSKSSKSFGKPYQEKKIVLTVKHDQILFQPISSKIMKRPLFLLIYSQVILLHVL